MTVETAPAMQSIVAALDGEAKCGKTTIINGIATEALWQAGIIPNLRADDGTIAYGLSEESLDQLTQVHQHLAFRNITRISAGNMFRAATLYVMRLETMRQSKTEFDNNDTANLRELLATPNIFDILQTNKEIGERVSDVSTMPGVQALCGTMFSDAVVKAYHARGGGNLVIVDARDPIGHLRRNDSLGSKVGQVAPASILPVYIDTPTEVAAARMTGDYAANLAIVRSRRLVDVERAELAVVRPRDLVNDYGDWLESLFSDTQSRNEPISPYRLDNGEEVDLDNVQYFSGHIAVAAQSLGHMLFHQNMSEATV